MRLKAALFVGIVAGALLLVTGVALAASCSINDGASYTNSPNVTVSFSTYGATQYRISNSSYMSSVSWRDLGYSHSLYWTLDSGLFSGDGTKYVYMEFRDGPDDDYPDRCNDSVVLDTRPPTTTVRDDAPWTDWVKEVEVSLSASDGGSGVKSTEYAFSPSGWWRTYSYRVTMDDQDESTLYYRSTDKAGNVEVAQSEAYKIDSEGPRCQAKSAAVKRSGYLTLKYLVADDRSNTVRVWLRVKNYWGKTVRAESTDYGSANAWDSFFIIAPPKPGYYDIVVTAKDEAGNQQTAVGSATLRVR